MTAEETPEATTHIWSTRQYPSLASNLLPATARLVSAAGITAEDCVLDVGCGTGNVALTARRQGASVVGADVSPPMLALAEENATLAEYGDINWAAGDAESLPFGDSEFDASLSNFGHVFAPNATEAANEMCRVTRPGGQIAFTAWSPDGLVGALTDIVTDHVTYDDHDPRGHLRWGTTEFVRRVLGDHCDLTFQRRVARFRYVSPQHFWQEFAEEAGPLSPALQRLDEPDAREDLREDALESLEEWFADNTVRVEYLLVAGTVE